MQDGPEANPPKPSKERPRPLRRLEEPAAPYPLQALGGLLEAAIRAIHERVQAPEAICAQSVLAAATLAVQGHANVVLPFGQSRPLSNFFLTIAETGERKTTADKEALRAVEEHERKLREQYQADHPSWENSNDVWKKQREEILSKKNKNLSAQDKKAALDALGLAPPEPLTPLLTCPEPSFEGLCKFLVRGQPSAGVFSGEGGQFIGGYGMSPDNRLKTAAGLSALWDGETLKRVRAGDGTTVLPGRRVSFHLMAQPLVANQILSDPMLADQGLLSRILAVAPDTAAGTRFYKEASPESAVAMSCYEQRLSQILAVPMPLVEGKSNELRPRDLPLSPNASQAWINFSNHIEKLIAPDGPLQPIKGLANKLPELAARLAGTLALVEDLSRSEIGPEHMAAGIELVQFYAGEALRLKKTGAVSPDILAAEKLLHWLYIGWKESLISLPDIYQMGPTQFSTAGDAKKAVGVLEQHGWLERVDGGGHVKGQRRRDVWRIMRDETE